MKEYLHIKTAGEPTTADETSFSHFIEDCWVKNEAMPKEWLDHFKKFEQEKTPEEERLIELAGHITNDFVEKHGGSRLAIGSERIHLIPKASLHLIPAFHFNGGGRSFHWLVKSF